MGGRSAAAPNWCSCSEPLTLAKPKPGDPMSKPIPYWQKEDRSNKLAVDMLSLKEASPWFTRKLADII